MLEFRASIAWGCRADKIKGTVPFSAGLEAEDRTAGVAEDQHASTDSGGGVDAAGGGEVPEHLAGLEVQNVEAFVLAADVNAAVADDGGGIDVAAGFVSPEGFAIGEVDGVDLAVAGADDDDAIGDGGGGVDHR